MTEKEINLKIRAEFSGKRDIDAVTKSIQELGAAVAKQGDEAKRGVGSTEQLKATMLALGSAMEELSAQSGQVGLFKKLPDDIAKSEKAVKTAGDALETYKAKLAALDAVSDEQVQREQKLRATLEASQRTLANRVRQFAELGTAMQALGVDTSRLADAEGRLKANSEAVSLLRGQQQAAIRDYSENVGKAAEATKELARQQGLLNRLQDGNEADAAAGRLQRQAAATRKLAEEQQVLLNRLRAGNETDARAGSEQRAAQSAEAARLKTAEAAATAELTRQQALLTRLQGGNDADALTGRLQRQAEATAELTRQQALLTRLQSGNEDDARIGRLQRQAAATDKLSQAQQVLLNRLRAGNEADAGAGAQQRVTRTTDAGLAKVADDAEKAAVGYSTLARASTKLQPTIVSLRAAVDAITDPAKAARLSLAGIESQIASVAKNVGNAKAPIKDAADQLRLLGEAQKSLSALGGQVDLFSKATAALRAQRTEFAAAKADVEKYAAAVRQGGTAGQAFTQPLAEAQARLRAASSAMHAQITAVVGLKNSLRDAGVSTSNLVAEQRRLTDAATSGVAASKRLADGMERQAAAGGKAGKGFKLFGDEGRTTLSLMQRLRGEVLALAAAYTGLFGVISLAKGALDASKQDTALRSSIAFAQGLKPTDPKVGAEIVYITAQADRLGISLQGAGKSYGFFSASALKAGAGLNETRFIFESFSETATVLGLSADDLQGVFKAVGQSFAKGKIQAEELTGQLGERLPGAFAFAQEALKDLFPDLQKALKEGKVGAENLVIIAESFRRAAADQLPTAIRSLNAEQERFNNSVLEFKRQVAEAGFADAYVKLLKTITDFLKTDDGKQFAQNVGAAFAGIVDAARAVVVVFRDFGTELKAVATLAGLLFASFAFQRIIGGLIAMRAALFAAGVAATGLQKAFVGFQIAAVVLSIASYLNDNRGALALWAQDFTRVFKIVFSSVGEEAAVFFKRLPALAANAIKGFLDRLPADAGLRKLFNFDDLERKLGALNFDTAVDIQNIRKDAAATRATLVAEGNKTNAARQKIFNDRRTSEKGLGETTAFPGARPAAKDKEGAEAEFKKRAAAIKALEDALDALDNKIDRKNKDVLKDQIAAVDREFADLAKRAAEVGGKEGSQLAARLHESDLRFRLQTEQAFNQRRADEFEKILKFTEDAEVASGRKRKSELDVQLEAIETAYRDKYRDIATERDKLLANNNSTAELDAVKARLDLAKESAKDSARQTDRVRELAEREQAVNSLIETRASKLKAIQDLQAAGNITQAESDERQLQTIALMQPGLDGMVLSAQSFANAMQGAIDPTKLDEFLSRLQLLQGTGSRLNVELDRTGKLVNDGLGEAVNASLNATADAFTNVANGTKSWGNAFEDAGRSILQTLAQILREIAIQIIKTQVLIQLEVLRKSLAGGGGGGNLTEFAGSGAAVFHGGGVVGSPGGRSRSVSARDFVGAPKYHQGGVPGLAQDEYRAILKKNEEVLTTTDPRNILNGGGLQAAAPQQVPQRFVLVDETSRIAEAMNGAEGEQVTMIHLRKNLPTLRNLLKGG